MRKKRMVLAALSLTLFLPLWSCYESDFPLGPPAAGKIDPKFVGKWRCVQGDTIQNKAILFTVSPFDDKQYSIGVSMEGEKPISYRAYSSIVKNTTLLNLQELKPRIEPTVQKWAFARYTFLKPDILEVEIVTRMPFKGIDSTPEAVRKVVERMIESPELYEDYCVCTRILEEER